MDKNITFTVDSDVYEKFNIALSLSRELSDEAANACLRWYIAQAFGNASKYTLQRQQSKPIRTKIFTEKHCSVFRCGR